MGIVRVPMLQSFCGDKNQVMHVKSLVLHPPGCRARARRAAGRLQGDPHRLLLCGAHGEEGGLRVAKEAATVQQKGEAEGANCWNRHCRRATGERHHDGTRSPRGPQTASSHTAHVRKCRCVKATDALTQMQVSSTYACSLKIMFSRSV